MGLSLSTKTKTLTIKSRTLPSCTLLTPGRKSLRKVGKVLSPIKVTQSKESAIPKTGALSVDPIPNKYMPSIANITNTDANTNHFYSLKEQFS